MSLVRSTIKGEYEAELARARASMEMMKALPPPSKRHLGDPTRLEQPKHQEDHYDAHYKLIRLGRGRGYHIAPKIAVPAPNMKLTVEDLLKSFENKSLAWRLSDCRKIIMDKISPSGFDLAVCSHIASSFSRGKADGEIAMMLFAAFMDIATAKSKGKVRTVFQMSDYIFTKLDLEFLKSLDVTVREISHSPSVNARMPQLPDANRVFFFGTPSAAILQIAEEKKPRLILMPLCIDDKSIKPRTAYAEARKSCSDAAKVIWNNAKAAEESAKALRPLLGQTYDSKLVAWVDAAGKEVEFSWLTLLWKKSQTSHALSKKEGKRAAR